MAKLEKFGKIASLYPLAVLPEEVETAYVRGIEVEKVNELMMPINDITKGVSKKLGIVGTHPLNIDKVKGGGFRRNVFGSQIKASSEWQNAAKELVNHLEPSIDAEEVLGKVVNPDWNVSVIKFLSDSYTKGGLTFIEDYGLNRSSPNKLEVKLGISHSYFDQALLSIGELIKLDALSVGGIIETSDGLIPYGVRAPPKFGNVLHLTPVGSTEPLGDNPIFNSFYNELEGEMGLLPNEANIYLVGRVVDFTLQEGNPRSYFTFVAKTDLTYSEVVERWKSAKDSAEHIKLESCPKGTKGFLSFLKNKEYFYEDALKAKAQGRDLSDTLPKNHGKMLPPATISTLNYFIWRESLDGWHNKTEKLEKSFNNKYDLTSCFNR